MKLFMLAWQIYDQEFDWTHFWADDYPKDEQQMIIEHVKSEYDYDIEQSDLQIAYCSTVNAKDNGLYEPVERV